MSGWNSSSPLSFPFACFSRFRRSSSSRCSAFASCTSGFSRSFSAAACLYRPFASAMRC